MQNFFEPDKQVKADEGYRDHPDKIKCPWNDMNPAKIRVMQGRVRARHKTLNMRLKSWGIHSQVFWRHITMHGGVFRVCAVVTQLTISNSELLFEVEYKYED